MDFNRLGFGKLFLFFWLAFTLGAGNIYGLNLARDVEKSAAAKSKTVRLFIIGNSFSQNAARFLPQLTKEKGHTLIIGRAELGGCSLQRHWEIVEAHEADSADPKGKQYGGKSLKMLLSEGVWDVVTIQQNSMNSGNPETYQPYASNLYNYIKKLQPQAEIIIHQTWAYRSDSKSFGFYNKTQQAANQQEMWEKSRAAYHALAQTLDVRLFPVGDAFWRVSSNGKWGYKPDSDFNFANPQPPDLPRQKNSLHVGYNWNKSNLNFDSNHANAAGEYLGSLIWYAILYNESPTKLAFVPEKVPADFGKFLRKVARKEVKKSKKYAYGPVGA